MKTIMYLFYMSINWLGELIGISQCINISKSHNKYIMNITEL